MSSPVEQSSLVLIRRLADGRIEWIPLEISSQHLPVAPEGAYTLVDRANYEAPKTLEARRLGEDLVVEVQGTEVLVLDGFFTAAGVAFYPTTNIAGGAGPFSGSPLTAETPLLAGFPAGEQVVWSAAGPEETSAGRAETATGGGVGGGSSPMLWVGVAAGGLGLAALAGGGGGSGGEDAGGGGGSPSADTVPPQITSSAAAAGIAENSGAGQVVYTATATDAGAVTYSLKAGGDAAAFSINASTGAVTITTNPNQETKASYSFTVVATDAANNSSERAVTLAINDLDEAAPTITSGATATAIVENSGPNQVVYTVTSTDTGDVSSGSTTYSLKAGGDAAALSINANTGAVTLTGNPDFETKSSYNFTVVAADAAGNRAEQAVSLAISNVNDTPVNITSGATAAAIAENSGASQVVYTVTATATTGTAVTYSLKAGGDSGAFSINATTGAVRLTGNPDHETKSSYSFTVVATDASRNNAEQAVSLAINDLDEAPPSITSGGTATAINENSGAGQVVYTVTSTDTGDVSTGSTSYSLKAGGDASAFSINANSGAVTLTGNPNDEAKGSYSFTVVATDAASNSSERAVSLNIIDLDEVAPNITSSATATAINENSGAGQVVYTVTSTDNGDVSTGSTSYSLKAGGDAADFTINANSGAVTLVENPNDEAQGSYSFTVVATDAAGNSSERAVSLNVIDLDEVAPTITSGATATAIEENSGSNQIVYTVTSTDSDDVSTGNTTYSLKTGGDSAAFSIGSTSGVVRLTADPDFEIKSSYSFTVVATDAANNSSEQAVTLAITDIADETPPEVDDVALTGAVGALNGILNAGDTVQVTVTMTENTVVNTAGGTPSIELSVGGDRVDALFVSGSGTANLIFEYTIQPGDEDDNGISIPANTLDDNGGSLADAAGNVADLDHGTVPSNSSFVVDTSAPTLSSSSPDDNDNGVPVDEDIVLFFSEDMQTGSGDIIISDVVGGGSDTRTINVTDGSQVSINGNRVTIDPASDLNPDSRYDVRMASGVLTDEAGNAYAGISGSNTLNFDTESGNNDLQGSSIASSRTFQSGVSDEIDIRVASVDAAPSTAGEVLGTSGTWEGSANLGSDDRIMLVGNGADAQDPSAPANQMSITEASAIGGGSSANSTDTSMPGAFLDGGEGQTNLISFGNMPAAILTSQGLV